MTIPKWVAWKECGVVILKCFQLLVFLIPLITHGNTVTTFISEKNQSDYDDRVRAAKHFADNLKKDVIITPKVHVKDTLYDKIYGTLKGTKYYGKCPDLLIGDQFYEIESFTGTIPKRAFSNMMKHGLKQSDRLIIKDCGVSVSYMLRSIFGRKDITEVWLLKEHQLEQIYNNQGTK
jgi:hypothetical protein